MPLGFQIADSERAILNALGRTEQLTSSEVSKIIGEADGIGFMERLMSKLGEHRLDLVVPGEPVGDEPTYRLRRV
jgi:hypothetical protein